MEFKGTKGKWHSCCVSDTPHYTFAKDGDITICGFYKEQDSGIDLPIEEMRANALLISKAPEILEMLTKVLSMYTNTDKPSTRLVLEAQQLIKEATEIK